jgi:hypothetical protein
VRGIALALNRSPADFLHQLGGLAMFHPGREFAYFVRGNTLPKRIESIFKSHTHWETDFAFRLLPVTPVPTAVSKPMRAIMLKKTLIILATVAGAGWAELFIPPVPAPTFLALPALQDPHRLRGVAEVEGQVQSIDEHRRTIMLRDALDQEYRIQIGIDTPISDTEHGAMSLNDLKENDHLRVYYTTFDMTARQVDRTSKSFPMQFLYPA